jgi:hypothetical protein
MNAWRYFPEHKSFLVAAAARQLPPSAIRIWLAHPFYRSRAPAVNPLAGPVFPGRNVPLDDLSGRRGQPTGHIDAAQIRMMRSRSSAWSAKLNDSRCLKK